jgi:hypothetical protein
MASTPRRQTPPPPPLLARIARWSAFPYAYYAAFLILLALFDGSSRSRGDIPAKGLFGLALVFALISFAIHQCSRYLSTRRLGPIATPIAWIFVTTAAVFGAITMLHLLKILVAMFLVRIASQHHPG